MNENLFMYTWKMFRYIIILFFLIVALVTSPYVVTTQRFESLHVSFLSC